MFQSLEGKNTPGLVLAVELKRLREEMGEIREVQKKGAR
jgi:hypothetical protein|tara:strand:- start:589 stop:705 length:117 start_codon:yes stop_codon:yes gene_type:complete